MLVSCASFGLRGGTPSAFATASGPTTDSAVKSGSLATSVTTDGLTTDAGSHITDTGVATWVGGDMYVGSPNVTDLGDVGTDSQTYAAEAEGLTVINGRLTTTQIKNSYKSAVTGAMGSAITGGFRWGEAGYGSQLRPSTGSSVLVVGGNDLTSGQTTLSSGQTTVSGRYHPTFILNGSNTKYYADIGHMTSPYTSYGASYPTLTGVMQSGSGTTVTYAQDTSYIRYATSSTESDDPTATVHISGNTVDYSSSSMSSKVTGDDGLSLAMYNLASGTATGTGISEQEAPTGSTTRTYWGDNGYKADKSTYKSQTLSFSNGNANVVANTYVNNGSNKAGLVNANGEVLTAGSSYVNGEKLIVFDGNQAASADGYLVFNLDASMLTNVYDSKQYSGVDFSFTHIPDGKSVIVNVIGSGPIAFNSGWRFWWNDTDISDPEASDSNKKAFAHASEHLMWNFVGDPSNHNATTKLTIYGGVAHVSPMVTCDDPVASFLGSILVRNGSFESHVSTNGRVYVGGDFAMYNPVPVVYDDNTTYPVQFDEGASASVLNMDQERHNFPFNVSSSLEWYKRDSSGTTALAGSTWRVYPTYADAVSGTNALGQVTDNYTPVSGATAEGGVALLADADTTSGAVKISGLTSGADYYLVETSAPAGYDTNITSSGTSVVYWAHTAAIGSTTVSSTVTKGGDSYTYTDLSKDPSDVSYIGDPSDRVSWTKVDSTNSSLWLHGSEWTLTDATSLTEYTIAPSDTVTIGTSSNCGTTAPNTAAGRHQLYACVTSSASGATAYPGVQWTLLDANDADVTMTATNAAIDSGGTLTIFSTTASGSDAATKVKATASGGAAAVYTLSSGEVSQSSTTDTDTGAFSLYGLDRSHTYTLAEKTAPSGYKKTDIRYTVAYNSTSHAFVLSDSSDSTSASVSSIPNDKLTSTIGAGKIVTSGDGTILTSTLLWEFTNTLTTADTAATADSTYALQLVKLNCTSDGGTKSCSPSAVSSDDITVTSGTNTGISMAVTGSDGSTQTTVLRCTSGCTVTSGNAVVVTVPAGSQSAEFSTSVASGYGYEITGLPGSSWTLEAKESDTTDYQGLYWASDTSAVTELSTKDGVSVRALADSARIGVIDNELKGALPSTGRAGGSWVFLIAGMGLVLAGCAFFIQSGTRKGRERR